MTYSLIPQEASINKQLEKWSNLFLSISKAIEIQKMLNMRSHSWLSDTKNIKMLPVSHSWFSTIKTLVEEFSCKQVEDAYNTWNRNLISFCNTEPDHLQSSTIQSNKFPYISTWAVFLVRCSESSQGLKDEYRCLNKGKVPSYHWSGKNRIDDD